VIEQHLRSYQQVLTQPSLSGKSLVS
jgi:hypothetical protein